jgi:hypothetical protein
LDPARPSEGTAHALHLRGPPQARIRGEQAPGARGTRLHRKIGDDRVLLAIATWQSKAHRDAMEARGDETVARIIAEQAEFVDIRVVGEFEDAEWEVTPELR